MIVNRMGERVQCAGHLKLKLNGDIVEVSGDPQENPCSLNDYLTAFVNGLYDLDPRRLRLLPLDLRYRLRPPSEAPRFQDYFYKFFECQEHYYIVKVLIIESERAVRSAWV